MPGWIRSVRLALGFAIFLSACSANILSGTTSKTSDEALYEDAVKQNDAHNYAAALADFAQLGSSYSSRSDVLEAWAGAYAGDCGLDFANYVTTLSGLDFSSGAFFQLLMAAWASTTVNPASCTAAEAKIKEIWVNNTATTSQQLFMVVLSMAKMGTYLRSKADLLGGATADAGFDVCTKDADSPPAGTSYLTDAEVTEVITGFSLFLQNIAGVGSSISSSIGSATSTLQDECDDINNLTHVDICSTSNAADVTPTMITTMRDLLDYTGFGIGSCAPPTLPNLCCP